MTAEACLSHLQGSSPIIIKTQRAYSRLKYQKSHLDYLGKDKNQLMNIRPARNTINILVLVDRIDENWPTEVLTDKLLEDLRVKD
jgi:hypothetical protein